VPSASEIFAYFRGSSKCSLTSVHLRGCGQSQLHGRGRAEVQGTAYGRKACGARARDGDGASARDVRCVQGKLAVGHLEGDLGVSIAAPAPLLPPADTAAPEPTDRPALVCYKTKHIVCVLYIPALVQNGKPRTELQNLVLQSESFRPWISGQPGRLFWKMPDGITLCTVSLITFGSGKQLFPGLTAKTGN
jgi:hypothetical protein